MEWTHSGTQLLVVREDQSVSVQRPGAPTIGDERGEREPCYVVDRWNWPAGQRESTCTLHLPYSAWPVNLWIASTDTLVAVRWMDQGASGWEPVVIRPAGDPQVRGAGFELASEVSVETYLALSPDERFAVSGYQTVYRSTPHGQQAPQHRGRFEVGRIVMITISAATYRDILVGDAVTAQRHGTAVRWTDIPLFLDPERFQVQFPTGAKRTYSARG